MDGTQLLAIAVIGYVSQWFRGFRGIPTPWVSAAMTLVALGLWFLWTPHRGPWQGQSMDAIEWLLAIHGAARLSQDAGAAPKTDSRAKLFPGK